ncbi:hypothetical protein N0V90_002812 [Kalmusia sp. IMI 367209]|nr:hypothetical protein N0V90_002812 [Kalmusia sp. IMI 367209]
MSSKNPTTPPGSPPSARAIVIPSDNDHAQITDGRDSVAASRSSSATATAPKTSLPASLTTMLQAKEPNDKAKSPAEESRKHPLDSEDTADDEAPTKRIKASLTQDDDTTEDENDDASEDEDETAVSADITLPYQSIISVNRPNRSTMGPPRPNDPTTWYTPASFQNSMVVYWTDVQKVTYTRQKTMFAQMFPNERGIGAEALRKRHIRTLQRQAKIYGVKPLDQIADPGPIVKRRGKSRRKSSGNAPTREKNQSEKVDAGNAAFQAPVSSTKPTTKKAPSFVKQAVHKVLEKTLAVVWHDHPNFNYSFKEIRSKLEDEFGWSIGVHTVEKNYHVHRPVVYGLAAEVKAELDAQNGGAQDEDTLVDQDIDESLKELARKFEGSNEAELVDGEDEMNADESLVEHTQASSKGGKDHEVLDDDKVAHDVAREIARSPSA